MIGADGIILDSPMGGRLQRCIVPDYTLEQINYAGGLEMVEGEVIDLIPTKLVRGLIVTTDEKLLPIYDILILLHPNEPNNN